MDSAWVKAYVTFEICVNASFLVPAALAWQHRRSLTSPLRALAWVPLFTVVMFAFSRLAVVLWQYNLAVGHLSTIGEGLLYLWYFRRLFAHTPYRRLPIVLQGCFLAFALLDSLVLEGFHQLNSYTNGLESFVCIGLVLLYFEHLLHQPRLSHTYRFSQDPLFLANLGIVVYMTGTVVVYLILNRFIQQNDADSVYRIYLISILMLLLQSGILTRVFWLVGLRRTVTQF